MRKITFIFLIVSCIAVRSPDIISSSDLSYKTYLTDREITFEISRIFLSDSVDYNKIMKLNNQIEHKTHEVYKEMIMSYVYEDTKQKEKFTKHLKKAISLGFHADYIKGFGHDRIEYINKLDTSALRLIEQIHTTDQKARTYDQNISREMYYKNMIFVDSINTYLLDSLVKMNNDKWLGFTEIGNTQYDYSRIPFINNTAVGHMSEIDNHRYYELIVEACEKNNEYWGCAEEIKWQQLKRFIDSNYNYMKLRHLDFDGKIVNIQDNKSLLTLNETAKLIKYNYESRYYKSVIHPTVLIKGKDFKSMGNSLLQELKELGVLDEEVVFDSSVIIPMDSLENIAEDYPFVIKLIEKE